LKQRNAALRAGVSAREINAWDHELASRGEELHNFRQAYLRKLAEALKSVSRELLSLEEEMQLSYRKGWASQLSYIEALRVGLESDREQRYTRSGPQRAELAFLYQGRPTVETFSRGQQKLLVLALQVAQASLLRQETLRTSLFLMDDLGAELDEKNQQRVMRLLHSIEAQAFVTAIDDPGVSNWDMDSVSRFHVKHGSVSEVLYSPG
jgi:DNA replication and repair protein RecF